ncbi:intermembrane phospholipid transport protein YdbH family protein [Brevundimonas sp.]|uniref:intermembrane phospholipid transport protein YdbH family protein n=1 Tax=Brevundimonas sp. TaxID=1871086 RepID=UPI002D5F1C05|nr:YdbH domain-containing protein [Brevundimonas sp.]HYD28313.1 YdbH domain-containing protein [Brevundimonas sp.]
MTDATAPAAPLPPPVRRGGGAGRRLLLAAGVLVCILLVLAGLLYLNRRAATRQVLIGWLERQGVPADMEIERVEIDGMVASIRIGDPRNPDAVVERVEVDYAIGAPWSKTGLGVTPTRIRLLRPVLRASFRDGEFSLGSLDPLVERFTSRPPRPDVRGPLVLIEQARVRLDTEYGPVAVLGDARVDDGKLIRLGARMPAADLKSGEIEAQALVAALSVQTLGDRTAVNLTASADHATVAGLSGTAPRLTVSGDLPYPDLKRRRGDGRARVDIGLVAARLTAGDLAARDAVARVGFDGQTAGWLETFRISGAADADLRAARLTGSKVSATAAAVRWSDARALLSRDDRGFGWRIDGPARVSAAHASGAGLDGSGVALTSSGLTAGGRGRAMEVTGPLALAADRIGWEDLSLAGARGAAELELVSDAGLRLTLSGGLRAAHGAWPLFGPAAGDDGADLAGMKRALGDFAVDIPAFTLASGGGATRLVLERPATLRPANGGVLTLSPAGGPVFAAAPGQRGGGALALTATRGKGLPEAAFAIPAWRLTPDGFTADVDGRAALDFELARGIGLDTRGRLTSSNGRITYVAAGCAPWTVERLELGENDVVDLSGQACPVDRPLVSIAGGRWRADGALSGLDASAPFLALNFHDAAGGFTATGGPGGLGLVARIERAKVEDATTPLRFNPLQAAGSARLADEDWTGAFDLSRDGVGLGRLDLAHDGPSGAGGLTIDAPSIVFAEGGLQPADLSPLAGDFVGSPASGSVAFQGRIDWLAEAEGSSSGRLTIPGLDFVSPAGPVKGLKGTIDFTSLAPLVTAAGQHLTADALESVTPLTDIDVTFALDKSAVTVEAADLKVAGGTIRIEPFAFPLGPGQPFSGVIVLENVQLGEVIAGSGFGDKVRLDAVVSGRLPFTSDPVDGVRISGGTLAAVQPGRLSIQREALVGVEAGGGGEGVPPNTVQDLAYQAMENLSFDILSADVNSLDAGRIGVLFHIRGRHDPPQRQELRIPITEFISREFLNRELPLPSDTQIDLTLDTTLNLNQLVGDLLELNRARNGQPSADAAAPPPVEPEPAP